MTSKNLKMGSDLNILNMEDNLKKFKNGGRPQEIWKWKTTSNFWKMKTTSIFQKMKTTSKKMKMEDDLNKGPAAF